jgi:hypothetical protein
MQNNRINIAEINTWVWLREIERKYGRHLTLDHIPPSEWNDIEKLGFNAIWLMGIWRRSPLGRSISRENQDLYPAYQESLEDWKYSDLPGSPYCIKDYSVDPSFGNQLCLEKLKKSLNKKGFKLILDFVPNHLARDNYLVESHPAYFIQGTEIDFESKPQEYFRSGDHIIAYGKDPFFPPWQDTAQVNAFSEGYRITMINELKRIGKICDGVRVDMAMLLLNGVFAKTWRDKAGVIPEKEFWSEIITEVRKTHPSMIFLAEVYWGKEWELMQLGFDYCYDKRLYDRIIHENAETIRLHLQADIGFQQKLVRYIENHDEVRASSVLPLQKLKAATLLVSTVPGGRLMYEGQWHGRKSMNHVLLGRRKNERVDRETLDFHFNLTNELNRLHDNGIWSLCESTGWLNNQTYENILSYTWQDGGSKDLIVINYSKEQSQARLMLPWKEIGNSPIKFKDNFTKSEYTYQGSEISQNGLFVDLEPFGYHFFTVFLK